MRDYTAFINDFCKAADLYQGASMAQKTALLQNLGNKTMKLAEYSSRAISLKVSMNPGVQKRLEALERRAAKCQKKFQTP